MKKISLLAVVTVVSLLQTGCFNRPVANTNQPQEAQAASIAAPAQSAVAQPAVAQPAVAPAPAAQPAPVAVAPAAAPINANSYFVNTNQGDPLNVRATNSTQAQVVGSLPQGTQVTMNTSDSSGQWFEVSAPGIRGWVAAAYLINSQGQRASNSLPAQAPAPVAAPQAAADSYTLEDAGNRLASTIIANARVSQDYRVRTQDGGPLNLRSAPSVNSQVLDVLPDMSYLGELEDLGDWVKVVTPDGVVGYAAKDFLYGHP